MTAWLNAPPPRSGTWQRHGIKAEIQDTGSDITIIARVNGEEFRAMLTRREMTKSICSEPHYFVQDVMGSGYADKSNRGSGVGRFLGNLVVQYLQHLADPKYRLICGELYHMPAIEGDEHADVRRQFFARFGVDVTGEFARALVSDLSTIPSPLPFLGGHPIVVSLSEFH